MKVEFSPDYQDSHSGLVPAVWGQATVRFSSRIPLLRWASLLLSRVPTDVDGGRELSGNQFHRGRRDPTLALKRGWK